MLTTRLEVADVSCNHCKMTIENGLSGEEGINSVDVDVDSKSVTIEYQEPEIGLDSILEKLDDLGYPATLSQ